MEMQNVGTDQSLSFLSWRKVRVERPEGDVLASFYEPDGALLDDWTSPVQGDPLAESPDQYEPGESERAIFSAEVPRSLGADQICLRITTQSFNTEAGAKWTAD
jgi:hypothetical protein